MKVKELQVVIQRLGSRGSESSEVDHEAYQSFETFVQKIKAKHHRRAEAGSSVNSSLEDEVEGLRVGDDEKGCSSSLDFLRRHARCLALVVGWLETTQATACAGTGPGARVGSASDSNSNSNSNTLWENISHKAVAVSNEQELLALVKTVLAIVATDLRVVLHSTQTAQRNGNQSMFHRYC